MTNNVDFIIDHLPWIAGSGIPLLLDFIIIGQFIAYRPSRSYSPLIADEYW